MVLRQMGFGLAAGILMCAPATADDWGRFRGPGGSGVSESSVPISWTPEANVTWKLKMPGAGVSSPIVVGEKVFVTCYSGYGLDRSNPGDITKLMRHLVCIDATTGEQLWQVDIAASQPEDPYEGIGVVAHGYASHTPVSDGEKVFAFFGKSGVYAFDLDGNQLWHAEVGQESDPLRWGSSSSPVVHGNTVIVVAAAESQSIVGLDKATGKELWRQEASGLDNMWSTPVLVKVDDGRTDLVMSVPEELWGLNPENGKLRWHTEGTGANQAQASVISDGGVVFAFTGRGGGSVAVKPASGAAEDSSIVWQGRDSSRFGSPISYDGKVYLVASGRMSVVDAKSGERVAQVRLDGGSGGGGGGFGGGSDYPSPVIANGHLYSLNGKGEMFVFSLAGDEPEQVSVNIATTESETFGGTPAISNGRLFIRSDKHLYCISDCGSDVQPNASQQFFAAADAGNQGNAGGRGGFGGGGRGGFGGGGGRGPGGGGFDPAAIYNRIDQNSDGKLTADELEGNPMASRFGDIDTNDDDAISLEEFRESMRNFRPPQGGGRGGFGGGGRGGFGGGGGRGGFGGGGGQNNRPERPQRPEKDTGF